MILLPLVFSFKFKYALVRFFCFSYVCLLLILYILWFLCEIPCGKNGHIRTKTKPKERKIYTWSTSQIHECLFFVCLFFCSCSDVMRIFKCYVFRKWKTIYIICAICSVDYCNTTVIKPSVCLCFCTGYLLDDGVNFFFLNSMCVQRAHWWNFYFLLRIKCFFLVSFRMVLLFRKMCPLLMLHLQIVCANIFC